MSPNVGWAGHDADPAHDVLCGLDHIAASGHGEMAMRLAEELGMAKGASMSDNIEFIEPAIALMEYVETHGDGPMNRHEGCYERQIDDNWWIAANGHTESHTCSEDVMVLPFYCYVMYKGMPFGVFTPTNGTFIKAGNISEHDLVSAIREATPDTK